MNFNPENAEFVNNNKLAGIKAALDTRRNTDEYKHIDDKARFANFNRGLHTSRIEDQYYDDIVYASEAEKRHAEKIREDLLLARDIDQQRNEERKKYKMRQYIRLNEPELREVEAQLRTAYTTKALFAQQAEKRYRQLQEKENKRLADELVSRALSTAQEAEQREKDAYARRQLQYKKELQDQMILNFQLKQNKYEDFLKEKKYLDYIIQRIYDEDQREKELKLCKMKKTQAEIEAFKEAQRIWKEQRRKELEEENKNIIVYMQQKEEQERQRIRDEQRKAKLESEQHEKMCIKLFEDVQLKEERRKIIEDLFLEESKQKDWENEQKELRKKFDARVKLQQDLAIQNEYKRHQQQQENLEELQYRDQLWAKLAEENKLEQLSNEKRRRKTIELRHIHQQMLTERRARRAAEMKQALFEDEQEKLKEQERLRVIEKERIRMLKQHADNLVGYFPPGALKPGDVEHLGPGILRQEKMPCTDIL